MRFTKPLMVILAILLLGCTHTLPPLPPPPPPPPDTVVINIFAVREIGTYISEPRLTDEVIPMLIKEFNAATDGKVVLDISFKGSSDGNSWSDILFNRGFSASEWNVGLIFSDNLEGNGQIVGNIPAIIVTTYKGNQAAPNSMIVKVAMHELGHYMGLSHDCPQCLPNTPLGADAFIPCLRACDSYPSVLAPVFDMGELVLRFSDCGLNQVMEHYIYNHPDGSYSSGRYGLCDGYKPESPCNGVFCPDKCIGTIRQTRGFCYGEGKCAYIEYDCGSSGCSNGKCLGPIICGGRVCEDYCVFNNDLIIARRDHYCRDGLCIYGVQEYCSDWCVDGYCTTTPNPKTLKVVKNGYQ